MKFKHNLKVVFNEEEKMILRQALQIIENAIDSYSNITAMEIDEEFIDPDLDILLKKAIILDDNLISSDFDNMTDANRNDFISSIRKDTQMLEAVMA